MACLVLGKNAALRIRTATGESEEKQRIYGMVLVCTLGVSATVPYSMAIRVGYSRFYCSINRNAYTEMTETPRYALIAVLVLRINRYCHCLDANVASMLHKQIHALSREILYGSWTAAGGNRKREPGLTVQWLRVVRYFASFRVRYHSFVALQEVDKRDETRHMITDMMVS